MVNLDSNSKQYLRHVKRELKYYSFENKREIICALTQNLQSFHYELPGANFTQICNQFGRPEKYAENVLESIEPDILKAGIRKRRISIVALIVVLVFLLIIVLTSWYNIINTKITHTTETTVIYVDREQK